MQSTGYFRHTDEYGRIQIPIEIREQLDLSLEEDIFEVFVHEGCVCFKKHSKRVVKEKGKNEKARKERRKERRNQST